MEKRNFNNIFAIALGANGAEDIETVKTVVLRAVDALKADKNMGIMAVARLYQSKAFPKNSGVDYINTVVIGRCFHSPKQILADLHGLEATFGRTPKTLGFDGLDANRWAARVLDLDLLFYGAQVLPNRAVFGQWRGLALSEQMRIAPTQLILPHPRIQDRAFVLCPLADVAPDWHHPVLGKTAGQMLEDLPREARAETWVFND